MIRINLSPKGGHATGLSWVSHLQWKVIGSWVLALFLLYSGWLIFYQRAQVNRLVRLTAEWESLATQRAELEQVQSSLGIFKDQSQALGQVKGSQVQWSARLNLLSDSIVSDLWFTSLKIASPDDIQSDPTLLSQNPDGTPSFLPQGPLLFLYGSAFLNSVKGGPSVNRFLERLKKHPAFATCFQSVELKSVQQRNIQREEVSDFVIILYPTG